MLSLFHPLKCIANPTLTDIHRGSLGAQCINVHFLLRCTHMNLDACLFGRIFLDEAIDQGLRVVADELGAFVFELARQMFTQCVQLVLNIGLGAIVFDEILGFLESE